MDPENDCAHDDVLAALPISTPEATSELSDERRKEPKGVLTVDEGKVESRLAGKVRAAVEDVLNDIEEWRTAPLEGKHPYVYLDGIWLKRTWGGEVKNVSVLVAIGVNQDGFRDIIGVAEGGREDAESWRGFLRSLKERGLKGVRLIVSDKCLGLVEALGEFFPEAQWQRCVAHFYRNVMTAVPHDKVKEAMSAVKAIHASEDRGAAREKAAAVSLKLVGMRLSKASRIVSEGVEETLAYYSFPREHWRSLRTNKLNTEVDRRRVRRSLTEEEIGKLLAATESSEKHHGMSGAARSLLYRFSLGTGARWNECRTLVRSDFSFEGTTPSVTIRALNAKNKRGAVLPLSPALAADLKAHMALHMPGARVFGGMWRDRGGDMIAIDLEAAGIPLLDEAGEALDFMPCGIRSLPWGPRRGFP